MSYSFYKGQQQVPGSGQADLTVPQTPPFLLDGSDPIPSLSGKLTYPCLLKCLSLYHSSVKCSLRRLHNVAGSEHQRNLNISEFIVSVLLKMDFN